MTSSTVVGIDLMELADRVEAASGPDRALAREVLLACGKGYVSPLYRWLDPTASLDAAVTLVPEGWTWGVFDDGTAWVWVDEQRDLLAGIRVYASTPALALTSAALRARASLIEEERS